MSIVHGFVSRFYCSVYHYGLGNIHYPFHFCFWCHKIIGKSTFADKLTSGQPSKFVRINQDQLGSRKECERLCRQTLAKGKVPIIDRCNFNSSQRHYFSSIASEAKVPVDCVVFTYPKEVCVARCEARVGHETISRNIAAAVVGRMIRDFRPPLPNQSSDEVFRVLHIVDNFQLANEIATEYLRIDK